MSITIKNDSVSTVVAGYACTPSGLVVWLDLAPQHVKVVGAIRAELTSNTRRYLRIFDREQERNLTVYGLGRGYLNLTADAAQLAVGPRAKAQMLRMIAPEAVQPEDTQAEFYALAWPQAAWSRTASPRRPLWPRPWNAIRTSRCGLNGESICWQPPFRITVQRPCSPVAQHPPAMFSRLLPPGGRSSARDCSKGRSS